LGVWAGTPLALGASAFAAERQQGTAQFLDRMAVSPVTVFAVKLGVCTILSMAALLALLTVMQHLPVDPASLLIVGVEREPAANQVAAMAVRLTTDGLAAAPPLLGLGLLTTIILVAVVVAADCAAPAPILALLVSLSLGLAALGSVLADTWAVELVRFLGLWRFCVGVGAPFAVLLWAEGALWTRAPHARWPQLASIPLLVIAVVASCVTPSVWAWALGPEAYVRPSLRDKGRVIYQRPGLSAFPANDGERVLLACSAGTWRWFGTRTAIVAPPQAGASWLAAPWQLSSPAGSKGGYYLTEDLQPWSPDGRRALVHIDRRVFWPGDQMNANVFRWQLVQRGYLQYLPERYRVWTAGAGLGQAFQLGGAMWVDNRTVFGMVNTRTAYGMAFLDVETGQATQHAFPAALLDMFRTPDGKLGSWPLPSERDWYVADRGVIACWEDGNKTVWAMRFDPRQDEGELLAGPVDAGTHNQPLSVSADGAWALLGLGDGYPLGHRTFSLLSTRTGRVERLALPAKSKHEGTPRFGGPRGELTVLFESGIGLYDPDARRWTMREFPDSLRNRARRGHYEVGPLWLSPAKGHAAVFLRGHQTAFVVDLANGDYVQIWRTTRRPSQYRMGWFGNAKVMMQTPDGVWAINRDGSGKTKVFP